MLRWFGHMDSMKDDWLVKRIMRSNEKNVRLRGHEWHEWTVCKVLNKRGM